ncbi:MAG: hypothetical protein WA840_22765 [Caulobacteraceae bacterium]
MIQFIEALPVGAAVRVLLAPPGGATRIRVLRKLSDDILGADDPAAACVYEGLDPYLVDAACLTNELQYYYQPFYEVAGAWVSNPSASVTPRTTFGEAGPDVQELVRQRLEAGLQSEVALKRVPPSRNLQRIVVQTAPSLYDESPFPIVTVHLQGDAPGVESLGELVAADLDDPDTGMWGYSEGTLDHVQLMIVGQAVSNPDTRILLRKAIKRVLRANRAVFDAAGLVDVSWSFSDHDDTKSFQAPCYQTVCRFSCTAPSVVTAQAAPVQSVAVSVETHIPPE